MFFCTKCNNFSSENRCSFCGAKKLREAQENDPVFLTTQSLIYEGMLEAALKENNIPFIKQEKHGSALKLVGFFCIEEYSFFVPFGCYEKAKEILTVLFEPRVLTLSKNPKHFKKASRSKNNLEKQ